MPTPLFIHQKCKYLLCQEDHGWQKGKNTVAETEIWLIVYEGDRKKCESLLLLHFHIINFSQKVFTEQLQSSILMNMKHK